MNSKIVKLIFIIIVILMNIGAGILLVSSVKSYINKIQNGDIQEISANDEEGNYETDMGEVLKNIVKKMTIKDALAILLPLLGLIMITTGTVILIKAY